MWSFSLSSFKSSLMLSMLPSVEELESLIIPYCHVFENRLHFLTFVSHLSFNFLLSSSHGSNPSLYSHHRLPSCPCRYLIFHSFSLTSRTEHVLNTLPSWSLWNYLSKEPSYEWNGFWTRELCIFYSGDAICPTQISDCATLNVFAISPCTGLQNWWFLMRWK
jgi:hypothetical protein